MVPDIWAMSTFATKNKTKLIDLYDILCPYAGIIQIRSMGLISAA
jgi:hypothetical protein